MDFRQRGNGPTWGDVWPGVAILVVLSLVSIVTFFGDAVRRARAEGPRVTVLAGEVEGLERGSAVWIAGKPAGRVLDIRFQDVEGPPEERVAIETVLLRDAIPYVMADARVTIGASGLLAPSVVKIGPGTSSAVPLQAGDSLTASGRPDLDDFRLIADSVRRALAESSRGMAQIRDRMVREDGSSLGLLRDTSLVAALETGRVRLERLSLAFREGRGLARALREDTIRNSLRRAGTRISELVASGGVRARSDSLRALGATLETLLRNAGELASGVERAEGTAGRAVRDSALDVAIRKTRAQLDSLSADLGQNPLAWLRIRLF